MSSATETGAPRTTNEPWVGRSIPRKEDKRLLAGQGQFVDDVWMHRQGFAHFVRSPYGHARVVSVDVGPALEMAGVYEALTGAEVKEQTDPFFQIAPEPGGKIEEFPLAVDKVRYQGDAVAVVLAETRELARDAAERVQVEYEPLDVVVDAVAAAEPQSPVLHDEVGHNIVWHGEYAYGDIDWALENADHVVKIDRLHFHRFSSTPLETFGAVVNWDPGTDMLEIRSNNQMPIFGTMMLAPTLRCGADQFFWHSQDIGGGFGIKICSYPQIGALALLSRKAGRPVKWSETRAEHMLSSGHGSERTFLDLEAAVQADGTILGFRVRAFDDAGAYLHYEPLGAVIWSQVLTSCYRFKHIKVDYTETVTNKCPTSPNRGYSRLQHMWMIERLVDTVALQLGFDPVEERKKNYVQPEDYPYETPNKCIYDSGNLPLELDLALEKLDYEEWRKKQAEVNAADNGRRIGIGIGSTLDSGTNNFGQAQLVNPDLPFSGNGEAAIAKLDVYGEIAVMLGTTPQGQSHETTTAQVVADMLGVDPNSVRVMAGFNKEQSTYVGFSGTYASQFAVTGIGAAIGATQKLRDEIKKVAAFALQCEEDDIVLADGNASYRGDEERAIPMIGIANFVYSNVAALPDEIADSVSLNCRYVYRPPFTPPDTETKTGNLTLTYANQLHVAVVEIDEETGKTTILDYVAMDDCGKRINPAIVEGQVHGATAHGIGAALHESLDYDEDGNLLQATFWDYHPATSLDVPRLKTGDVESPSPFSKNGAKGMGEGGGAPLGTICAAIQDALGPDVLVTDTHNPPERVFELLEQLRDGNGDDGFEVVSR